MKWEKQLENRRAEIPAPWYRYLHVSSEHSEGNGSFGISDPPT